MSKADDDLFSSQETDAWCCSSCQRVVDFWQLALSTNLFGLVCPIHCGSPS